MFQKLLSPRQVVLVTAASGEKSNVTAVQWIMPVSEKPPLLALSLANTSFTLDLICSSMEFVVAVPSEKLRDAVRLCGSTSGKFIEKFGEAKLTPVKANRVRAPLILEAVGNFECKVVSLGSTGDHTVVTGEVVDAHAQKEDKELEPLLFSGPEKDQLVGIRQTGQEQPAQGR